MTMSEDRAEVIGFIGLGEIGGPMIARLIAAGHRVVVFDVDPPAMAAAEEAGAVPAASARAVAELAGLVMLCLPSSREVELVCLGEDGISSAERGETVVIDFTSGAPLTTVDLARRLGEHGIALVDAPVSGRTGANPMTTAAGELTVIVGGEDELVGRCTPILEVLAEKVIHVGGVGAAHLTKALNNVLVGVAMLATSEMVAVATSWGLDPRSVVEAIDDSSGHNFATEKRFPDFVLRGDFGPRAGGPIRHLHKDVAQAVDVGTGQKVPMLFGSLVQQLVTISVAELGPDAPSTAMATVYEKWAGVEMRDKAAKQGSEK
jgi:3-hydroxyisobutyrate dehydrogenase-like beta-hydroxyacid dehydrogenase